MNRDAIYLLTICALSSVAVLCAAGTGRSAGPDATPSDNAQPKPGGGYGDPIPPSKIIADYERIKAADPTRPVLLNLGQGVANDEWRGRGPHPQDYREYVKGGDIISFDVYPVVGIDKPN